MKRTKKQVTKMMKHRSMLAIVKDLEKLARELGASDSVWARTLGTRLAVLIDIFDALSP